MLRLQSNGNEAFYFSALIVGNMRLDVRVLITQLN
jgi:hypothetical protein